MSETSLALRAWEQNSQSLVPPEHLREDRQKEQLDSLADALWLAARRAEVAGRSKEEKARAKAEVAAMFARWRSRAEAACFFGDPVPELTHDKLLEMIGWLLEDQEAERKSHTESLDFMLDVQRAKG